MRLDANKKILGIKAETTRGTAITVTTADCYECWDLDVSLEPQVKDYSILQNSLTRPLAGLIMGAIYGTITCKMYAIVGQSTAQAASITAMTRIWNACGLSQQAESTVETITPDDTANTSVSVLVNVDGRDRLFRGCSGNCQLVIAAGEVPYWDITLTGVYTGMSETAALVPNTLYAPTKSIYSSVNAMSLADGAGSPVSMLACWKSITLDPGYAVAPLLDLGALQGVKYFSRVGNPAPKVNFTCYKFRDAANSSQYDAEADAAFRLNQTCTLAIATSSMIAATGKLISLNMVEDNGWVAWEGVLDLRGAAEAEWKITIENAA